jgi:methyltransferase family protein
MKGTAFHEAGVGSAAMAEPEWIDDNTAVIGDTTFLATVDRATYLTAATDDDRFVILKHRPFLERMLDDFRTLHVDNMVEAGIFQGGSVVWWNLVLEPVNHLAFDLRDKDVEALKRFAAATPSLTLAFGINQRDTAALSDAVQQRFGNQPLDLVIDDCSHFYEASRIMFEVLFPRLRPGGFYVIEDWQWAHSSALSADEDSYFAGRLGLSNLVVEALLIAADGPAQLVHEVTADAYRAIVVRGPAPVAGRLDLDGAINVRGGYKPTL